ncbi:hypothetical protein CPSG_06234 [Coccidioides posadasii str. Silveira]|uniref:Uncharacterized protein n=1 Tax=Coccidioides posadasii (strain RMSCC 757 / Silveira) TaxID=443226 RepID=E9D8T2_COCPS|nr:hypothetical protein CPSG_06234 [Coccidioides posadasii str. Silveira]
MSWACWMYCKAPFLKLPVRPCQFAGALLSECRVCFFSKLCFPRALSGCLPSYSKSEMVDQLHVQTIVPSSLKVTLESGKLQEQKTATSLYGFRSKQNRGFLVHPAALEELWLTRTPSGCCLSRTPKSIVTL